MATQFAKGISGNPKGRPKGSRNMASILREIAARPVSITEGNRSRTVPLKEAVLIQMANSAARGDRHSRRDFLQLTQLVEAQKESEGITRVPHERDKAVLTEHKQKPAHSPAQAFAKLIQF